MGYGDLGGSLGSRSVDFELGDQLSRLRINIEVCMGAMDREGHRWDMPMVDFWAPSSDQMAPPEDVNRDFASLAKLHDHSGSAAMVTQQVVQIFIWV